MLVRSMLCDHAGLCVAARQCGPGVHAWRVKVRRILPSLLRCFKLLFLLELHLRRVRSSYAGALRLVIACSMLPWISAAHASTSARQIGPVDAHVYWVSTRVGGYSLTRSGGPGSWFVAERSGQRGPISTRLRPRMSACCDHACLRVAASANRACVLGACVRISAWAAEI